MADTEQFNVLSHNARADGGYSRVIAEFVRQGPQWMEYQFGQAFAAFEEGARDQDAIYLFDESRSMWVRITTDNGARTAVGSWSAGERGVVPERWTPMDPVAWR